VSICPPPKVPLRMEIWTSIYDGCFESFWPHRVTSGVYWIYYHNKGEGISVLVASLLIWSITQSSKPNQRTSDATCWPNPWTEWTGSQSSRAHQTRSWVQWLFSRWPGPVHPSAQHGGSPCNQAFSHPAPCSQSDTTSTSSAFKKLMLTLIVQAIFLLVDLTSIATHFTPNMIS